MTHKDLGQYKKRMLVEAIIKSIILGLIIGCVVALLIKGLTLLLSVPGTLLSCLVGLGFAIAASFGFYFLIYRPNEAKTAVRVDGLGLDERVITMLQYENAESNYIIEKQRENTKEKLTTVTPKQMKLSIVTLPFIILMCLIPVTAGSYAISHSLERNTTSSQVDDDDDDGNKDLTGDEIKDVTEALDALYLMVDLASIKDPQKELLYGIIDDLKEDLKNYPTYDAKMAVIEETRDLIIKMIKGFIIINNLVVVMEKIIDKADIKDESKELLLEEVAALELRILEAESIEDMITIVTEFLIILQDKIVDLAVAELGEIINGAEEAPQEIKDQCWELVAELEERIANVHETYEDKMKDIEETKQKILELLYPPQEGDIPTDSDEIPELGDVQSDISQEVQDALDNLGQVRDDSDADPDGEQPIDPDEGEDETEDPNDKLPPPPPEGDVKFDPIIDGNTDFLKILKDYIPDIEEKIANGELTPELKELIENYLSLVDKNKGQEDTAK